jgi:hypothetical protein
MPWLQSNKVTNFIPFSYAWLLFLLLWSCDFVIECLIWPGFPPPVGKRPCRWRARHQRVRFQSRQARPNFDLPRICWLLTLWISINHLYRLWVQSAIVDRISFHSPMHDLLFLRLGFRPMSPMKYSPMKYQGRSRSNFKLKCTGNTLIKQLSLVKFSGGMQSSDNKCLDSKATKWRISFNSPMHDCYFSDCGSQ